MCTPCAYKSIASCMKWCSHCLCHAGSWFDNQGISGRELARKRNWLYRKKEREREREKDRRIDMNRHSEIADINSSINWSYPGQSADQQSFDPLHASSFATDGRVTMFCMSHVFLDSQVQCGGQYVEARYHGSSGTWAEVNPNYSFAKRRTHTCHRYVYIYIYICMHTQNDTEYYIYIYIYIIYIYIHIHLLHGPHTYAIDSTCCCLPALYKE